jgi:hypothetical protein
MRKQVTILVMLFCLSPVLAVAEQGVYRDRSGNTVGSWSDSGGQRTYRDSYGNTTGTSVRDNDRRDYRDRDGNYVGSRERGSSDGR